MSSTAWERGRCAYCSQLLVSKSAPPLPSSPAQQDTVPPDDWECSHNHRPSTRSRHTVSEWIKQVVDIVCWALRTPVSESRYQDKVGVVLLPAPLSNNAAGYEFWAQIYHCVWHCVWPTAGIWWENSKSITSPRQRLCFDVKYMNYTACLLWKYGCFRSLRRVNMSAVKVNMFKTFGSHTVFTCTQQLVLLGDGRKRIYMHDSIGLNKNISVNRGADKIKPFLVWPWTLMLSRHYMEVLYVRT